jgi:tryptophan synthase beta chain
MNEAMRDWVTNVHTTHYCVGSAAGPHPYPTLVADLQRVIGDEARAQCLALGALPDVIVACVGGGSNAIGMWKAFLDDVDVNLVGVEAAGRGLDTPEHAATLNRGRIGVLHGAKTFVLCDEHGQIVPTHSISAGLDYPGVGPEHAALRESKRATYTAVTDEEALSAARDVAMAEGIIVALESAHAFGALAEIAQREARVRQRAVRVAVCVSGRGDKDLSTLAVRGRG